MSAIKLSFPAENGLSLSGILDLPAHTKPHNFVIFAHCFTCNKNFNAVRTISCALNAQGFAVLRFDFTGLGDSEGAFEETSFSSNVCDLVRAASYLATEYSAPSVLIGHSLGGAAVLAAALKIPSIKAVATIGAPFAPSHVEHLLSDVEQALQTQGKATVNIGGRPFVLSKQFLDDIRAQDPIETIKKLNRAVLIMHSPQDSIVGIDNAASIYQTAKHPKSFLSLDTADHLLSKASDASYAGNMIASWAMRYVEIAPAVDLRTDQQVMVRMEDEDGFLTHILAGKHRLLADEPESVGGADLGPTPYGFLSAGLGACTAMTLKMYARRKKWDLKAVNVHLSHEKIYAQDCECDLEGDKQGRLDKISRLIEVEGCLDDIQIQRLLEIADLCPVHKTLESKVLVTTRLLDNKVKNPG